MYIVAIASHCATLARQQTLVHAITSLKHQDVLPDRILVVCSGPDMQQVEAFTYKLDNLLDTIQCTDGHNLTVTSGPAVPWMLGYDFVTRGEVGDDDVVVFLDDAGLARRECDASGAPPRGTGSGENSV